MVSYRTARFWQQAWGLRRPRPSCFFYLWYYLSVILFNDIIHLWYYWMILLNNWCRFRKGLHLNSIHQYLVQSFLAIEPKILNTQMIVVMPLYLCSWSNWKSQNPTLTWLQPRRGRSCSGTSSPTQTPSYPGPPTSCGSGTSEGGGANKLQGFCSRFRAFVWRRIYSEQCWTPRSWVEWSRIVMYCSLPRVNGVTGDIEFKVHLH